MDAPNTLSKLIISAPFGRYFRGSGITLTLGTYTLHRRAGIWTRLWRAITTIRYNRRTQSWINRMCLPSPGIRDIQSRVLSQLSRHETAISDKILSIHGFTSQEWYDLASIVSNLSPIAVELNVSCPNVSTEPDFLQGVQRACTVFRERGQYVIAKLPPIRWMDLAVPLYHLGGIQCFHLCNSIPSPGGGISGKVLKQYSLWAVEEIRRRFPDVEIIGGGGITDISDINDYLSAGANRVAIGSMLFNPLNWRKVPKMLEYLRYL